MDNRKWEADALGTAPTAPVTPSSGYPTNGDPGSGQNATEPGAWWFHAIGEEIRAVLIAAGFTPAHNTLTQLRDAIAALSPQKFSVKLNTASGIGVVVPLATGTLAIGSPVTTVITNPSAIKPMYVELLGLSQYISATFNTPITPSVNTSIVPYGTESLTASNTYGNQGMSASPTGVGAVGVSGIDVAQGNVITVAPGASVTLSLQAAVNINTLSGVSPATSMTVNYSLAAKANCWIN